MRSKTIFDRFDRLYIRFCKSSVNCDAIFTVHARSVLRSCMNDRGISGPEGFSEMRNALDVFEYDLEPSDPAFCHQMNLILNTLEMMTVNKK